MEMNDILMAMGDTPVLASRPWLPAVSRAQDSHGRPGDLGVSLARGGVVHEWAHRCASQLNAAAAYMGHRDKGQYAALREWELHCASGVRRCVHAASTVAAEPSPTRRAERARDALDATRATTRWMELSSNPRFVDTPTGFADCKFGQGTWPGAERPAMLEFTSNSILADVGSFLWEESRGNARPWGPGTENDMTARMLYYESRFRTAVEWVDKLELEEWDGPIDRLRALREAVED